MADYLEKNGCELLKLEMEEEDEEEEPGPA
jgi:transposase